jgi:2-keto-4-pentenoate hydratase/2-oxohepta-3-ene-1,7-dioic acid hydratase in catechol pathway
MKLASFLYQGKRSYGIVQADGVVDLGRRLGDRYSDLKALLQGNGLADATRYVNDVVDIPMSAITFLPVIEQPEKILCVGMNYADKRKEFDQHNPAPTLFVRFADSQTGHNSPVLKPRHSCEFDYEGELAVIIGKGGENIRREDALSHVGGYSCYMDGSARDWQHTWFTAGKNWRQTGAFGPWMATADEIPDPHSLAIHQQHDPQSCGIDRVHQYLYPSQPRRRDHHRVAGWCRQKAQSAAVYERGRSH